MSVLLKCIVLRWSHYNHMPPLLLRTNASSMHGSDLVSLRMFHGSQSENPKPRRWTFRLLEAQLFSFYKALICSWSFLRVFCSSHGFPWSAHTSPELRCLDIVIIETTICRRWAVSQGWVHLHVSQRGCNRRALDVNQTYCGFQVRLPSQIRLSVLNFFAMPYLYNLTSDRVSYMPPLQVYHHSWWWALCVPWWKEWRSTIPSLVLQVWVGTVYLVKRVANLDSTNHCAFGVLSAR